MPLNQDKAKRAKGLIMVSQEELIRVQNLHMYFHPKGGIRGHKSVNIKAVDGVSFSINRGEILGLVGESGCGKTTTGRCILRLYEPTEGKVYFKGQDLSKINSSALRSLRRDMQLIFEDPFYSLDPRMRVGDLLAEPLIIHKIARGEECKDRVAEQLLMVQLEPDMADRFPHEFSAGQRQRIEIARALIMRPSFVVCDNPTSQLDVSIQAQIIDLLMWFRGWLKLTYLFIAHDLAVIRNICDRVMVMYAGKIVEIANRDELYHDPLHPYTRALLSSVMIPDPEIEGRRKINVLRGDPPSPIDPPLGCRFRSRCEAALEICKNQEPELKHVNGEHFVACHRTWL